jgi:hypothetical protein
VTAAERAALIVRAKALAVPVASCVRAGIPHGHLTAALSRDELQALIVVLAESASPERLHAVTRAPGDTGMPPADREYVLRRHADHDPSLTCRPALGYGLCEVLGDEETEGTGLWVCYCGQVAPWSWSFPHWDCQGGRPLSPEEIAAREGAV